MTQKQAYLAFVLAAILSVSGATPAFAVENGPREGVRPGAPRIEAIRQANVIRRASTSAEIKAMKEKKEVRKETVKEIKKSVLEDRDSVFDFGRDGGPVTAGKVTSVNGTSFTIETIAVRRSTTTKSVATTTVVFTVDASSAKVLKDKATTTVASITVGDAVVVKGKVTGTSIIAKAIIDTGANGTPMRPGMKEKLEKGAYASSSASTTAPRGDAKGRPFGKKVENPGVFRKALNFFTGWFR